MSTAEAPVLERFLDELEAIRIHHSKTAGPSLKKPLPSRWPRASI